MSHEINMDIRRLPEGNHRIVLEIIDPGGSIGLMAIDGVVKLPLNERWLQSIIGRPGVVYRIQVVDDSRSGE